MPFLSRGLSRGAISLNRVDDSFPKIVVTGDRIRPWRDDKGILYVNVEDFLLKGINEL